MNQIKQIEVVPYNSNWPILFESEEKLIQKALGDNCVEIHHVGSTAVPGLSAKPTIDIIAVVKNGADSILQLPNAGYDYKGEWNIPFKYGFSKRGNVKVNLHVFEENHPEIHLNLVFRDHLRNNPQSVSEYEQLKVDLLSRMDSFKKQEGAVFSGYNLGKDAFIRKILQEEGYKGHRFLKVTHFKEWEEYHRIRKAQVFDPINIIYDPQHPSIHGENNYHFILCEGMHVVSVAHIEFLDENEAALWSLATDKPYQGYDWGVKMMSLLERWLKKEGIKFLKIHARRSAEIFYLKLGYQDCLFDDQSIKEDCVDLGKNLN